MNVTMLRRILRWKTRMNMILTLYLEGWLSATPDMQASLPYSLDQDTGNLVDQSGAVVGRIEMVNSNINVIWLRSHSLLDHLDQLGEVMQEQLVGSL